MKIKSTLFERREMLISLFFYLNMVFWSFIVFKIFYSSISYTTIETSPNLKAKINLFTPQAWGFFTKNPREEDTFVYEFNLSSNTWIIQHRSRNGDVSNIFGLNKRARLRSMELGYITSKILSNEWTDIRGNVNNFLNEIDTVEIKNIMLNPTFSGDYLIELKEPIPWAWSKSNPQPVMPSKIVLVQVKS